MLWCPLNCDSALINVTVLGLPWSDWIPFHVYLYAAAFVTLQFTHARHALKKTIKIGDSCTSQPLQNAPESATTNADKEYSRVRCRIAGDSNSVKGIPVGMWKTVTSKSCLSYIIFKLL